jgi:D-aspartate ligase
MAPKNRQTPPAIVLGMTPNGLGVIRSLGRSGIPVLAISSSANATTYSRYCHSLTSPDLEENENRFLDFLVKLGRKLDQPGILFPTGDAYVRFISENREDLNPYFRFALPDKRTLRQLLNKKTQYLLAGRLGIPLPKMFYPESLEDWLEVSTKLHYPAVVKSTDSVAWRKHFGSTKLLYVKSKEQLLAAYQRVNSLDIQVMIQEAILGNDARCYKLCTYMNRDSKPLLVFTLRKIRNYPCNFGVGSCVESQWLPEVADLGLQFLRDMKYVGVGSIEFKRDLRDNRLKMIELNSRLWWQNSLAAACGQNFPHVVYKDLTGDKVERTSTFREGITWVSMASDFASFRGYHAARQLSYGQWLKSLRGPKIYEIFAWDDPKPFLRSIDYGSKPLKKAFRVARRIVSSADQPPTTDRAFA